MISIDELLARSTLGLSEARALLAHILGVAPAWIVAHGRDAAPLAEAKAVEDLFARRRAGEPMAYLTGEREFRSLSFLVTPDVLIPRPETELVVEQGLELMTGRQSPRVLDLGTGSGAIAVSIGVARPDAQIWVSDISGRALEVASRNALRHGVTVRMVQGDWFAALGEERFDLVASNPPYIAEDDPHLDQGDLRFEPRAALVGGIDGMRCISKIAAGARTRLVQGGWLILEHGYDQGTACARLMRELGYTEVVDIQDLSGMSRVCAGRFDAPLHAG